MRASAMTDQHEIDDCLEVDLVAKVLVVSSRESSADAVVDVHHTRHSVEAEAVEHELFHVVAQVGQQEAENFVVAVVEQAAASSIVSARAVEEYTAQAYSRIPQLVRTLWPGVEVQVVGAVERVEAIIGIF